MRHCSRTHSISAFLADSLKRACSGDPRQGTGPPPAERAVRDDPESRLARDSMDDWREPKESPPANSSICETDAKTFTVGRLAAIAYVPRSRRHIWLAELLLGRGGLT